MSIEIVFKTTQPEVLQQFETDRAQTVKEHHTKCDAFKESIGGRDLFGTRYYAGGFWVCGYIMDSYREALPAGWRQESRSNNAVPAKRTPEGKAIAAELAALQLKDHVYPGMPSMLHAPGFTTYPRLHNLGGEYFMTISKLPDDKELQRIDSALWTRVKLSEYYAAVEATS